MTNDARGSGVKVCPHPDGCPAAIESEGSTSSHWLLRCTRGHEVAVSKADGVPITRADMELTEELEPLDMFAARATDPETSHARAARENDAGGVTADIVLQAFRWAGRRGLTYRECATNTGLRGTSVSSTISVLLKSRLLEETSERRDGMKVRRAVGV